MYQELVASEPGKPVLREYEEYPLSKGQVRVKVDYGSPKHGTEMNFFMGTAPQITNRFDDEYQLFIKDESISQRRFFLKLGNMWVGHVVEIDQDVENIKEGERVAGFGCLSNTQVANAVDILKMNASMSWKQAVCFDPAQFAHGGIRDGNVRLGDAVAIFGLGAIGLIAAQMARMTGASFVAVIDPIQKRREVALKYGADLALNPLEVDVGLELKKATGKKGVDVAIETSASYHALQQAIRGLSYAGNIAVIGRYKECKSGLDFGMEAHYNQPNIIFSRACSLPNRDYPRWDYNRIKQNCWRMLSQGHIGCEDIVNPVVPFDQSPEAYKDIELHPEKSVKLGVDFTQ